MRQCLSMTRKRKQGFSMLEAVISLGLFALLMAAVTNVYKKVTDPEALGLPADVMISRSDVEEFIQKLDEDVGNASAVFVYEGILTTGTGASWCSEFDHTVTSVIGMDENTFLAATNADNPITVGLSTSTTQRGITVVIVNTYPEIEHFYYIHSAIDGSDVDHTLQRLSRDDISLDITFTSLGQDFSSVDFLPSIVNSDDGTLATITIPNPVDTSLDMDNIVVKALNYAVSKPQY